MHADIADRRRDGAGVRRAPARRRAQPRRRDARRSVHRRPAALHRHQHRRHVRAARSGSRQFVAGSASGLATAFRFLHVSTDEVYGTLGPTGLFSEETPYAPNSPYAASKASADHLVRAYFHTYGMPVLITNCSNNYGPYQFPEKLIPLMILNALERPAAADLRRRRQRPRLAARGRSLRRHSAGARQGRAGREVQYRRRQRARRTWISSTGICDVLGRSSCVQPGATRQPSIRR